MRINSNLIAGNAQRNLGLTTNKINKNVEKLSSGLKINRAADDAAGLSISEKMRSQIRGLEMASKNSQDGISLIQSAEGALNESHEILQRMRELVVQAANGVNADEDIEAIQSEIDQLVDELDRIAESTQFNGKNLLDGNLSESADLAFADFDTAKTTWETAKDAVNTAKAAAKTEKDSFKSLMDGAATAATDATKAQAEAAKIDAELDKLKTAITKLETDSKVTNNEDIADAKADIDNLKTEVAKYKTGGANATQADAEIIANLAKTAMKIADDAIGDANSLLKDARGAWETAKDTYDTDAAAERATMSKNQMSLQVGANQAQRIGFNVTNMRISDGAMDGTVNSAMLSLSDLKDGELGISHDFDYALGVIDDAIKAVSETRSGLGAIQNRLEHTVKNVDTVAENLTSAESRIRDVDMASEMVEFTNNNIKTQAATAMLAQANTLPQTVLQLLN